MLWGTGISDAFFFFFSGWLHACILGICQIESETETWKSFLKDMEG